MAPPVWTPYPDGEDYIMAVNRATQGNNTDLGSNIVQIAQPIFAGCIVLGAIDQDDITNASGLTPAQRAASPRDYCDPDPSALTGQVPGSLLRGYGSTAGEIYAVNDAGVPVKWMDNGALVGTLVVDSLDLGDNDPANFGDANDLVIVHTGTLSSITNTTGDLVLDNTDVNDQIILRTGTDTTATGIELRNESDVAYWTFNPISASAGRLFGVDNSTTVWGTGGDLTAVHDGTNSSLTSITGNLNIINTAVTGFTILKGGTATSATGVRFTDSADQVQFSVTNDGAGTLDGTLTAGGLTTAGTVQISDGGMILQLGAGTGTGDKIACLGVDATHGIATYVYQATVSPAAIETALFTIPAMSVVDSVQANVQSALTGGGTTVTFGVGITGDVDAYGTASNSGVQADLLTQNAKINTLGTTTNAGASIGVWSAGTVALKLIGAATGGASAGDTALTVGSVLVRVVYRTLLPLANA